jgi:hypothetical protein
MRRILDDETPHVAAVVAKGEGENTEAAQRVAGENSAHVV